MEVQKQTTEEKLIKATFNILKTEGISKVTTKKISEEAGVSEVTIFRKFKNKDNLLEKAKKYYLDTILNKIDEIFSFDDNIITEDYLKSTFKKIVELPENELNMLKVAMEEVYYVNSTKKVILIISSRIIQRLTEYFQYQINKKRIREVKAEVLAMNIFGILFESLILWKIYGKKPKKDIDYYAEDFLDIILNGISNKS